jgi:micrococcal nuclease
MLRYTHLPAALVVIIIALTFFTTAPVPVNAQAPEGWHHVARVIDGDTVELDDGTRVRLFGVSTPELNQRCGPEARDVLAGMLADRQRANNVYLEYGPRTVDDFGRTLAYVWVNDGGEDWSLIDEWMVLLGYGEAWTRDGQFRDRIIAAEEIAVQQGAGCLWSGRTPPPATTAAPSGNCSPAYPTVCIPPPPPDLDCGDIPHRRFPVLPPDPHRFDGSDNDGIGCESG